MVVLSAEPTHATLHPSDRTAERLIRERLVDAVGRSLGDGRLLTAGGQDEERVRALIDEEVSAYDRRAVTTNGPLLLDPPAGKRRLFDSVFGMGILQPLMDDARVEEIIVNGPLRVFTIKDGTKEQVAGLYFESDDELRQLVKRVVSSAGRRLDEASPMVDVRLRDGSRLNAVIPPASTRWTCVTVRKFVLRGQSLQQLVELGTMPGVAADFLEAAVQAGVNILVSGQTGSGKTTLLNALGASIAGLDERIVIEDSPLSPLLGAKIARGTHIPGLMCMYHHDRRAPYCHLCLACIHAEDVKFIEQGNDPRDFITWEIGTTFQPL